VGGARQHVREQVGLAVALLPSARLLLRLTGSVVGLNRLGFQPPWPPARWFPAWVGATGQLPCRAEAPVATRDAMGPRSAVELQPNSGLDPTSIHPGRSARAAIIPSGMAAVVAT
jgi:hypothetical protein